MEIINIKEMSLKYNSPFVYCKTKDIPNHLIPDNWRKVYLGVRLKLPVLVSKSDKSPGINYEDFDREYTDGCMLIRQYDPKMDLYIFGLVK